MSKKIKAVIAIGGTGGHVIPGYNLALHLKENNFIVDLKSYMLNMKYEYVTIPNLANNKLIIDLLEMKPGLDLYYYTYNLNQHKFCNKDFCFNIN